MQPLSFKELMVTWNAEVKKLFLSKWGLLKDSFSATLKNSYFYSYIYRSTIMDLDLNLS